MSAADTQGNGKRMLDDQNVGLTKTMDGVCSGYGGGMRFDLRVPAGLVVVVVLLLLAAGCDGETPDTLRLTQILFRHGDRSPLADFPSNARGEEAWPGGYGQLTQLGMQQSRDLGRFIRTRYNGFLNSTYLADQIYVRSSDTDRTLMSAEAVLAGLYPPQGFQQWDSDINWQPIPVHTVPTKEDIVLNDDAACPHDDTLLDKALGSEEATQLYEDNKYMIGNITEKAGFEEESFHNIWQTADTVAAMSVHNMSLPEWLTEDTEDFLHDFYHTAMDFRFFFQQQLNLRAGPFLHLLSSNMQQATEEEEDTEDTEDRRVILYSSLDTLLASVLLSLGAYNDITPPFCAALFFELHEIAPDNFTVQIFYKNDTVSDPTGEAIAITLPGCTTDCPLDVFLQLLAPTSYSGDTDQWIGDCSVTKHSVNALDVAVSVLAVAACIIVAVAVLCCALKKPFKRQQYQST